MSPFVHLSVHTEYSLVDSIVRVKPLVAAVQAAGMPAIAITDQTSVAAMVKHLVGENGHLPASVRLPEEIWNTGRIVWPGQDAGWLGNAADPWLLTCDPNAADFRLPELSLPGNLSVQRLQRRRDVQRLVDQQAQGFESRRVGQVDIFPHD